MMSSPSFPTMSSLQDTNIVKALMTSTAARSSGVNVPMMKVVTISDKRKFDAISKDATDLGSDVIRKALQDGEVKAAVDALQNEVESKRARLREMQKEVCASMKPSIANMGIKLMVSAIQEVDNLKRAKNVAAREDGLKDMLAQMKTVIESDGGIEKKMGRIKALLEEYKNVLKPATSYDEE